MTKLTVQNAQVTTAAVEIQTLTISGKQVTLAVFRQLQEETPPNDRAIAFDAWGRVNYCPDSSCKRSAKSASVWGAWPRHVHIVWQNGNELRRSTLWSEPPHVDRYSGEQRPSGRISTHMWDVVEDLPQLFIAV